MVAAPRCRTAIVARAPRAHAGVFGHDRLRRQPQGHAQRPIPMIAHRHPLVPRLQVLLFGRPVLRRTHTVHASRHQFFGPRRAVFQAFSRSRGRTGCRVCRGESHSFHPQPVFFFEDSLFGAFFSLHSNHLARGILLPGPVRTTYWAAIPYLSGGFALLIGRLSAASAKSGGLADTFRKPSGKVAIWIRVERS